MKTKSKLRDKLRHIVTRGGQSARIPEILELELDDLEKLFKQVFSEELDELERKLPKIEKPLKKPIGLEELQFFNNFTNGQNHYRKEVVSAIKEMKERIKE